jgi:hypothetical protein
LRAASKQVLNSADFFSLRAKVFFRRACDENNKCDGFCKRLSLLVLTPDLWWCLFVWDTAASDAAEWLGRKYDFNALDCHRILKQLKKTHFVESLGMVLNTERERDEWLVSVRMQWSKHSQHLLIAFEHSACNKRS